MTLRDRIHNEYFEWMYNLVCKNRYSKKISYRKLLMYLHDTEFVYTIPNDANRAEDGIDLRYKFAVSVDCDDIYEYIDGPCSVLEMMIALAIRCEEDIMDDPNIGDRTGQWFWGMIVSLGHGSMLDSAYDKPYVEETVTRFLNRGYEPNGKGGLFTCRHCNHDLRHVEIWYQMCYYLNEIL